ncbi:diguanylate cyclase [Pigmentiphaga aceris]|uniref:diguanylate cyclase n=1 Tax=Pigmentiphaga aceris TaxID=1940612 RepID=A0A5C0AUQ0_9BURK|nr:GGDEF domain-containing protein [Pigmentiphaga aceris]QEI06058.1 diguanylate cyclase [Pigmentiphaga aceris]
MTYPHKHADLLAHAQALLQAGQGEDALSSAHAALEQACESGKIQSQAEAMLCLASIELRLFGRFAHALDWAQNAGRAFERAGLVSGECQALSTQAVAAARLGHYGRAIENALLAVRLARWQGLGREQLQAYRAVGLAAFNARNFDEARNAYTLAIQLALRCDPSISPFELHVGLAANAAAHYFCERSLGAQGPLQPILDSLARHVGDCRSLLAADDGDISLTPGSHANNLILVATTEAQLRIWQNRLPQAHESMAEMLTLTRRFALPWLAASVQWVQAELFLAENKLVQARGAAASMIEAAKAHDYESLTWIGLQLASHIDHVRQDDSAALRALQELLRREQSARARSLETRIEVIDWQLELRQSRLNLAQAETDSRLFERLAMEDPLTGLPNRRHIEKALTTCLAAANAPLCVALVDVDRFKRVNDDYSHTVGDAVLKAIAGLLQGALRECDFVGRLGGDEFVLLLDGISIDAAQDICSRIDQSVRTHGWETLAAGLKVTLSIGLTEACAGDTAEHVLARSDDQMYAVKRRGRELH